MNEREMPAFPTRPAEVPAWVGFAALVEAYQRHAGRMVDATCGVGEKLPREQVARHALAELVIAHALARRALAGRWVTGRDALSFGATREQVAQAMGLDDAEVRFGLSRWADGQRREGLMDSHEQAEVYRLLDDAGVEQDTGDVEEDERW